MGMRAGNTEDNEQTLSRMSGDEGQKQGSRGTMTQCPYQALASCDRVMRYCLVALSILSNGFTAHPFVLTHEGATPPDGRCYANICGVLCSRTKKRMFRGFDVATPAAVRVDNTI
jgi:hypothetical protein